MPEAERPTCTPVRRRPGARDDACGGGRASCLGCAGRARSEWSPLTEPEVARLDRGRAQVALAPGEAVFRQGDACGALYCVESGLIGLRRTDGQGHALLVGLAHASDALGCAGLFAGGRQSATAEALVESRVCVIDRATVEALVASNQALAGRFLRRLAREVRAAEQERMDAVTLPVRARLAQLLLGLADRYGRVVDAGAVEVVVPLARQDMAALLGVRPESVARAVRALSDAGVARFAGRRVSIPSVEALVSELPEGA